MRRSSDLTLPRALALLGVRLLLHLHAPATLHPLPPLLWQGADVGGATELAMAMVQMCYDARTWGVLNETIAMRSERISASSRK